jgi:hypothetical protein
LRVLQPEVSHHAEALQARQGMHGALAAADEAIAEPTMRYKRLKISPEFFLSLFTEGMHPQRAYTVIADAVPADAKLVHVRMSWPNDLEMLISSETFPEVKKGEEIPLMTPTMRSEP